VAVILSSMRVGEMVVTRSLVTPNINVTGDAILSELIVGNNALISGSLINNGEISAGPTTLSELVVGGNATVSGSIVSNDAISASGNISAGLDVTASGNMGVSGSLQVEGSLRLPPSGTTLVTADGGFTVTATHMHIEGAGGPVNITANPQIAPGIQGDLVHIEGGSDTNTVQLNNGNGLHLHNGSYTIGAHDSILMMYGTDGNTWEEMSRNAPASDKSWAFRSQDAGAGSSYIAGYYLLNDGDDDFSSTATLGDANGAYGAHAFIVLGVNTEDDLTITFSGTSITDDGVRTTSDTEAVVFTHPTLANAYVETDLKWIGAVSIDVTSGTAKDCNFGLCKYWDNRNTDFRVIGLEATWRGGAGDSDPDIKLINHSDSGWAYHAASTPGTPPPIVSMKVDYGTEHEVSSDEEYAWKRTNLNFPVSGATSGGIMVELVTQQNKTFEVGNFILTIRPD